MFKLLVVHDIPQDHEVIFHNLKQYKHYYYYYYYYYYLYQTLRNLFTYKASNFQPKISYLINSFRIYCNFLGTQFLIIPQL
jgi:hypothetical protein